MKIRAAALAMFLAACGGGGGGGSDSTPAITGSSLALFAGNVGGPGSADGLGPAARFRNPNGIAIDGLGNLYVADMGNGTIRRITPSGAVTTFAGTAGNYGSADGIGPAASFSLPKEVAVDGAGNVYVGDWSNYTVRKISPAGVVSTLAGMPQQCGGTDGPAASATFCFVEGVAVDAPGNVFVSSASAIRRISPAGVVSTFAGMYLGFGSTDGPGPVARFNESSGIATDVSGNVYVADTANNTIRKVAPDGMVTTVAGMAGVSASVDGTGSDARFILPLGVGTDQAGNVFVADGGTNGSTIRRITPAGMVTTIAGSPGQLGSADGVGAAARFNIPTGVAADGGGNVYVADRFNHTIRRVTPAGTVTTIAGSAEGRGSADGTGSSANFTAPEGVAVDSAGNVIIADGGEASGIIRRISPSGVVTTIAGDASALAASTDGVGREARFIRPTGVAIDNAGNIYVGDVRCPSPLSRPPQLPCSGTIRRVAANGTVSTFAGTAGVSGFLDGLGAAASFMEPRGVAIDGSGNLYVADRRSYTVRRIDPSGAVTTLAGLGGNSGDADGVGSGARFRNLSGIGVDAAGNVFVTDGLYVKTLRRITPAGVVTTIDPGEAGRGDAALAADAEGNLYVADPATNTIRKRTPAGVVTTIVGVPGQATFEPGPLPGKISSPVGLAVRGTDLYITLGNGVAVVRNRP